MPFFKMFFKSERNDKTIGLSVKPLNSTSVKVIVMVMRDQYCINMRKPIYTDRRMSEPLRAYPLKRRRTF